MIYGYGQKVNKGRSILLSSTLISPCILTTKSCGPTADRETWGFNGLVFRPCVTLGIMSDEVETASAISVVPADKFDTILFKEMPALTSKIDERVLPLKSLETMSSV